MTLPQLEYFVCEMKNRNAYIGRIRLVGGEPSIHPKLTQIVDLLHSEFVPTFVGRLEIVTNGSHPERILPLSSYFEKIRISDERDKQKYHTSNLVHTPASLGYEGRICNAPFHCGFSLNYFGYFPCSAGAGIARMQDWMKWQRLELPVSVLQTWPDLQLLCNHCYHALKPEHKIKCGTGTIDGQHALNAPGKDTWQHLAPWLQGKQADWPVYGAPHTKVAS